MKKLVIALSLILMVSMASGTIATFSGTEIKQGSEAEYSIGVASDQELEINFSIPEKKGLNISYPNNANFEPESTDSQVSVDGKNLPLEEFYFKVDSINPQRHIYSIPVQFSLTGISDQDKGTRPKVVQEREYVFEFETVINEDDGLEGLISNPDKENDEEEFDSVNISDGDSEDSLKGENNTNTGGENANPEKEEGANILTWLLVALITLISVYIVINLL